MPSVRDSLKSMLAGRKSPQQEQHQGNQHGGDIPDLQATNLEESSQVLDDGMKQKQDDLIAQRWKMVADQRAALAKNEMEKLQQHLEQLQDQLKELNRQGLSPGSLSDDIDQATQRLNEAKSEFSRASEVRKNTDLAMSLRQENQEQGASLSSGSEKVREKLGGPTGGPKLGGDEGMEMRARLAPRRR